MNYYYSYFKQNTKKKKKRKEFALASLVLAMGPNILQEGSFHNIEQRQLSCTQLSRKYTVVLSLHRTAPTACDHMHWLWWKWWILTLKVSDEINCRLCKNYQLFYTLKVQACYKCCNSRIPLNYWFSSCSWLAKIVLMVCGQPFVLH